MNKLSNGRTGLSLLQVSSVSLAGLCGLTGTTHAEVSLAMPFSDRMVLQREMAVPVWGSAEAGEKVTVEFGGQKKSVTADANGKWLVKLDALTASAEPRTLSVQAKNKIILNDVLVGEVWFCSGQSNMLASIERLKTTKISKKDAEEGAMARINRELESTTPGIRLLHVGKNKVTKVTNPWTECDPQALHNQNGHPGFSAVGYFFGKKLHQELKVPVGLIESAVGGTVIETWTPPEGKNFEFLVKPLPPFAIRGVLWYQGESNVIASNEGAKYADKMQVLIESWRKLWERPELPFYYVQLPPMAYTKRNRPALLTTEALPQFRDGQTMALRIPHTDMVVTTDLAYSYDLHPTNKWDIGYRLALLALAHNYGRNEVVYSGPVYKGLEKKNGALVLSFDHIGGGLVSHDGKPLSDFMLAGADRQFVRAEAAIEAGKVIVSSKSVPEPVAVRFGWHEESRPNFFNKAGLPARPFRTDDWPVQIVTSEAAGAKPAEAPQE